VKRFLSDLSEWLAGFIEGAWERDSVIILVQVQERVRVPLLYRLGILKSSVEVFDWSWATESYRGNVRPKRLP
jgi:hypothetical protein